MCFGESALATDASEDARTRKADVYAEPGTTMLKLSVSGFCELLSIAPPERLPIHTASFSLTPPSALSFTPPPCSFAGERLLRAGRPLARRHRCQELQHEAHRAREDRRADAHLAAAARRHGCARPLSCTARACSTPLIRSASPRLLSFTAPLSPRSSFAGKLVSALEEVTFDKGEAVIEERERCTASLEISPSELHLSSTDLHLSSP